MTVPVSTGWKWVDNRDVYEGLPAKDWKEPILLDELAAWIFDDDSQVRISQHLIQYLSFYKGRFFEVLREQSSPQRFDIFDVSAAEALSVKVLPRSVNRLLSEDETRDALMDEIYDSLTPGKDTLWTCDEALLTGERKHLETSGALFHLYYLLRQYGIGPVTTSKLLAAKFPNVVPIRDSQVSSLLRMNPNNDWWLAVRSLFVDPPNNLVDALNAFALPDDAPNVSTLRRLDIILWMEALARGF